MYKNRTNDAYSAELTAEEVETESKAFLLNEDGTSLRLVVLGDENSKRSVSNVVQIKVE